MSVGKYDIVPYQRPIGVDSAERPFRLADVFRIWMKVEHKQLRVIRYKTVAKLLIFSIVHAYCLNVMSAAETCGSQAILRIKCVRVRALIARRQQGGAAFVSVFTKSFKREARQSRPSMSRRNIKPTTFHDDSRSSDAGSVVTAPPRPKPRTIKDPVKEFPPLRDSRAVDPHPNGVQTSNAKLPPLGPDGEIQVCPFDVLCRGF
jgi:hypothetical protein